MTSDTIKKAALQYFAKHGYEGASMSQIAEEVGIKKQSIYTHFNGKDVLFRSVLQDVVAEDMEFINRYFQEQEKRSLKEILWGYISLDKDRYDQNNQKKFFLRMMYFPPMEFQDLIIRMGYDYVDCLEEHLISLFQAAEQEGIIHGVEPEQTARAFVGVLDAANLELLFGGTEKYELRLNASWQVFWRGITK